MGGAAPQAGFSEAMAACQIILLLVSGRLSGEIMLRIGRLDARAPAASAPTRKRGSKAPTEAVIAEEAGKGYHLLLIGVGAGGGGPRRNRRKGRKGQPSGRHGGPSSFRQIGETWVPTSKRSCAMPFESAIDSAFRYEPRSAGASMQRRPFCGN